MESDESGEGRAPSDAGDSDFQDSDNELFESDEGSGDEAADELLCDEELKENEDGRNEMPTKKVKTEHSVPDEQIYADESSERIQKRIKTERVDNQTRTRYHSACPTIALSSDDESRHGELPIESNAVASSNLKVVFDVEYEAPE